MSPYNGITGQPSPTNVEQPYGGVDQLLDQTEYLFLSTEVNAFSKAGESGPELKRTMMGDALKQVVS